MSLTAIDDDVEFDGMSKPEVAKLIDEEMEEKLNDCQTSQAMKMSRGTRALGFDFQSPCTMNASMELTLNFEPLTIRLIMRKLHGQTN